MKGSDFIARLLSYEDVSKEVVKYGSKLLSTSYEGSKLPIKVLCMNCNKEFITSLSKIRKTKKVICQYCARILGKEKRDLNNKVQFSFIKYQFEKLGASVLSSKDDYINTLSHIKCVCSIPNCNETFIQTWTNFKSGFNTSLVCKQHKLVEQSLAQNGLPKIPWREVEEFFKENGVELL